MDGPRKFFTSSIVDLSSSIRQNWESFNLSIFDFSVNGEFAFDTSPEKSALVRKRFTHNSIVDWDTTNDNYIFNLIFVFLSGQSFSQFFQGIIGSQNIAIFWFLGDRS